MIPESAVKSRSGRTLLPRLSPPSLKSAVVMRMTPERFVVRLVIWQRMTSSPSSAASTSAGLRLDALRSENGKGDDNHIAHAHQAKGTWWKRAVMDRWLELPGVW